MKYIKTYEKINNEWTIKKLRDFYDKSNINSLTQLTDKLKIYLAVQTGQIPDHVFNIHYVNNNLVIKYTNNDSDDGETEEEYYDVEDVKELLNILNNTELYKNLYEKNPDLYKNTKKYNI